MSFNFYDEDFKKSIVSLYQSGKSQTSLSKEYGVSLSAINKWVKRYSEIKTEDGDIFNAFMFSIVVFEDLDRYNSTSIYTKLMLV